MAANSLPPGRLDPSVLDHLAELQTHAAQARDSLQAGHIPWCCADMAHQAIGRALKDLDTARRALEALDRYQGGTGV